LNTTYDCIPCFIRQTLDAVRFATADKEVHELVLRKVLKAVSGMDLKESPPVMGQKIHRIIRNLSGSDDPYRNVKKAFNQYALSLYPVLKEKIESSHHHFETAVRLAIGGNIIDFGVNADVDQSTINKTIESSLSEPLLGDMEYFQKIVRSADKILYLGDNTGEIVFDRLLVEQLPIDKVTFAVRGRPVINDATYIDALETGMTDLVNVIDNGSDAPGTIIEDCSDNFKRFFQDADVVIAKGQGNYETLSDNGKKIVFLLKVKCHVIAGHMDHAVGDSVINLNLHKKSG